LRITRLTARHFRNLLPLELLIDAQTLLFVGGNGQGKTNLLEALYVSATGRSFRHSSPKELLAFGSAQATLSATVQKREVRHDVEVVITPHHKSVMVDSRHLRLASKLLELVNVVAFFPDDLRVVKGAPEERRRLLDRAVANYRPDFVTAAMAYAKVLKSRNVLLKERRADRTLLRVYDEQLVSYASVIHACRLDGLAALAPLATEAFADIMPDAGPLVVGLDSGVPQHEGEAFAEALRRGLNENLVRDLARGTTSLGPHRADLEMLMGGQDARIFASQGQQRAVVLALKLAEVRALTAKLAGPPVLLLDDISSELDARHTEMLFAAISKVGSQVWVSTTGAAPLPVLGAVARYDVAQGRVTRGA